MLDPKDVKAFLDGFTAVAEASHRNAVEKGFWDGSNFGEKVALIHSELSEALEAERSGNSLSDKIPPFTHLEEELADVIIRLADLAAKDGLNVAGAVVAKMDFNRHRPFKHGKAF